MNKLIASTLLTGSACLGLSATSVAQLAAPAATGLEEIVVTANKREEKLEKVGLTVTAISSEALAEQRVTSLQDVAAAVPGLTLAATTNNPPIFTMRGNGYNGKSLDAYP